MLHHHHLFRLAVVTAVLVNATNVILPPQQRQHALNMHTLLQVHVTVELRVVTAPPHNKGPEEGDLTTRTFNSRIFSNDVKHHDHHPQEHPFPLDNQQQRQWILSIDEVSMTMPALTTTDDDDDDFHSNHDDDNDDNDDSLVEMEKHLSLSWTKMMDSNASDQAVATPEVVVWMGTTTVSIILPLVDDAPSPLFQAADHRQLQPQRRRRADQTPLTRTLAVALWEQETVPDTTTIRHDGDDDDGSRRRTFLSRTLTHVPRMVVQSSSSPQGSSSTRSGSTTAKSATYTQVAIQAVSTYTTTGCSHDRGSLSTVRTSSIVWGKGNVMLHWIFVGSLALLMLATGLVWSRRKEQHVPWQRHHQQHVAVDGQDEIVLEAEGDDDQEQEEEETLMEEEQETSSSCAEEEDEEESDDEDDDTDDDDDDEGQGDDQGSVEEQAPVDHDEHDVDESSSPHYHTTHPNDDTLLPQLFEAANSNHLVVPPGGLLPPRFRSVPPSVRANVVISTAAAATMTDTIDLPPTMERLVVRPWPAQGITFESEMERFNRLNLAASPSASSSTTTASSHGRGSRGTTINRQYRWPSLSSSSNNATLHHQPPDRQREEIEGERVGQRGRAASSFLAWNDPSFATAEAQAVQLLQLPPPPVPNPWMTSTTATAATTTASAENQPLLSYRPCYSSISTQKGAEQKPIPSFAAIADSLQAATTAARTEPQQTAYAFPSFMPPTFVSPVAVAGHDSTTTVTLLDHMVDGKKNATVAALSTELFGEDKTSQLTTTAVDNTIVAREQEKSATSAAEESEHPLHEKPLLFDKAPVALVAANHVNPDKEIPVKVVKSNPNDVDTASIIERAMTYASLGTRVDGIHFATTRDSLPKWPVPVSGGVATASLPIPHDGEQNSESNKQKQSYHARVDPAITNLVKHQDFVLEQAPVTVTIPKTALAVEDDMKAALPRTKTEYGAEARQDVHPIMSVLKSSSSTQRQPENDSYPLQNHDAAGDELKRVSRQEQQQKEPQPVQLARRSTEQQEEPQPVQLSRRSALANDEPVGTAMLQPKLGVLETASLDKTKDPTRRSESKKSPYRCKDSAHGGAKSIDPVILTVRNNNHTAHNAVENKSSRNERTTIAAVLHDPISSATADIKAMPSAEQRIERRGLKRSLDEIEDDPKEVCATNDVSKPLTESALAGSYDDQSVRDENSTSYGQPASSSRGYSTSTYASTLSPDSHTTVERLDDQWPFTKSSDKAASTESQATTKGHSVTSISFEKPRNSDSLTCHSSRPMNCASRVAKKQPQLLQEAMQPPENVATELATHASVPSVKGCTDPVSVDGLCTTGNPNNEMDLDVEAATDESVSISQWTPCLPRGKVNGEFLQVDAVCDVVKERVVDGNAVTEENSPLSGLTAFLPEESRQTAMVKLPVVPASVASTKNFANDVEGSHASDNSATEAVLASMVSTDERVPRTDEWGPTPCAEMDESVQPPPEDDELQSLDSGTKLPFEGKVAIHGGASGPRENGEDDDSVQVMEPQVGLPAVAIDDILPEFIPSISLQRAAQRVQAPVWQMSAAEAETIASSAIQPRKFRSRRTNRATRKARRSSKTTSGSQSQSLNSNTQKMKREQMRQNEDEAVKPSAARSSDLPVPPSNLRSRISREKWLERQHEDKSIKTQSEKQLEKKRRRSRLHDSSTEDSSESDRPPSPKRKKTSHVTREAGIEVMKCPPPGAPTKKMKSISKTSQSTSEAPRKCPPPGAPTKKKKSFSKTSQSTSEAPSAPMKSKKQMK